MNDVITVVSGLPRSGTSLMMQMLDAGGLAPLTDGLREADLNNPRGYYELEKAKQLKEDSSWLADAQGKAVKIISMLLYDLPRGHEYDIIFMTRDMDEVLASQRAMLDNMGTGDAGPNDGEMRTFFETHLAKLHEWLSTEPFPHRLLNCNYNELLADPERAVSAVAEFCRTPLSADKMAGVIDRSLHRQRGKQPDPDSANISS